MSETPTEDLLWLDLETTGLRTDTCHILEVAAVITGADMFAPIAGYKALIAAPSDDVQKSEARTMHQASGLWNEWWGAFGSKDLASLGSAEANLLRLIPGDAQVTLAGSGIGTFDLQIIRRVMPGLASRLTYHVHDIGVLRRAYRRATGNDLTPRTEPAHRAMADVQQSLTEGRAFADLFRGAHHE